MEECIYEIFQYLDDMRINHTNSGYRYLAKAIQICLENPLETTNIMDVYRMVGITCNKNQASVEKAIRYSIFPTGLTNKKFIWKVVDDIYSSRLRHSYFGQNNLEVIYG